MTTESGHGPGDLVAIRFDGAAVPDTVREAFLAAVASGVIRILDLLVVKVADDGAVTTIEPEDLGELLDTASFELDEQGLVGAEDADVIAESLEPGQTPACPASTSIPRPACPRRGRPRPRRGPDLHGQQDDHPGRCRRRRPGEHGRHDRNHARGRGRHRQ